MEEQVIFVQSLLPLSFLPPTDQNNFILTFGRSTGLKETPHNIGGWLIRNSSETGDSVSSSKLGLWYKTKGIHTA